MANLGTFGTPKPAGDADSFTYFDAEIRVHPACSDLALWDFLERSAVIDVADPGALTFVKDFIRELVHAEDFDKFWALARVNGQNTEDLMALAKGLFAALTGRPTQRPADSSGGPRRTRQRSKAASSLRMPKRLSGRPDLQLAVVAAHEARVAAG